MQTRPWLLLLLPLLALAGWLLLGGPIAPEEPAAPTERGALPTNEGPLLEGLKPMEGSAPTQTGTAAPSGLAQATEGRMRVFGDVVLPQGVDPGIGVVALLALGEPVELVARKGLAEGLTFDWSMPWAVASDSDMLRVVLIVPGLPTLSETVAGRSGGEARVHLRPVLPSEDTPRIEGRVTDHQGRAMQGFHLVLSSDAQASLTGGNLPNGIDDLFRSAASRDVAVVTTGPDGQFETRCASGWSFWPYSLDPRWVVRLEGGAMIHPGAAPVTLVATPAARVRAHVRDAVTGTPLATHGHTFLLRSGGRLWGSYGWGGSGADFEWATPATGEVPGALEIELRVTAHLYEPFSVRWRPDPGGMLEELTIHLRALGPTEIGELVVQSGLRDARGKPVDVQVSEIWEEEGMSSSGGLPSEPVDPGDTPPRYRMAAGRHRLKISLNGSFGMLMHWAGAVEVPGGQRTLFAVPWAPYGSLRLRLPSQVALAECRAFNLRHATTGDNVGFSPDPDARETFVPGLPVGTWLLTTTSATTPHEQRFEVAEGVETVVEVEP